jgi:uncharacterized protein (TIGR02246 family)
MTRNGLLFCTALAALMAGCAPAGNHDADVQAIKDTEAAWVKDAATRDVEKFAAYYTEDASVLLPNAPAFNGKEAIRGALKPVISDPNFALNFAATRVDVAKSGELAYAQGAYTMTTSDPNTHAPVTEKGKYLTVYRKQADGNWKAVADTVMSDAPPPAPTK